MVLTLMDNEALQSVLPGWIRYSLGPNGNAPEAERDALVEGVGKERIPAMIASGVVEWQPYDVKPAARERFWGGKYDADCYLRGDSSGL